jgi:ubiquinol-cytochrome c reductase cytochrome b subunit
MKSILTWFNDRTGLFNGCGWLADSPLPGRPCWCKVVPSVIAFLCCVQAITGFVLWAFYSPSAQTAWESVYYVQHNVAGGWLLRAMHHYSAHVLLAVLILAVAQNIFAKLYRAPRELVFWATVGLGLFALAAILTGDLLSWDQNGYASTKTRTGFLTLLPWVGGDLLKIAIGGPGPALGHHTLTRFFALHVGVFAAGFIGILIVRYILARRAAVAIVAPGSQFDASCPCCNIDESAYWPALAVRSMAACIVVMGVVLLLACQHGTTGPHRGTALLSPADTDPANAYDAARPEWFLVGVYEFSHLFAGELGIIPIFIVPGLLVGIALLMPFIAKIKIGQVFNVVFTIFLLAALVGMTWYSYKKDAADPKHQAAIAYEQQQADRICTLISHEGIPPTGALALFQSDPKTQGPRLFAQQCASCHDYAAVARKESEHVPGVPLTGDIKNEKPSAPNLAGFASRSWLTGFLNPKGIKSMEYFGNTKFRGDKMANFLKDIYEENGSDSDFKKNMEKMVAALSAEARLPSQTQLDKKDEKAIQEGRKLLVENCAGCHRFHSEKRPPGDAPDLTGYGSPEWLAGIVGNPADTRFYGKINDRMPAYASSANPKENALGPQQIKMVIEWLRGVWYEK